MKNADALIGVSDFVLQSAKSLGLSPRRMHCVHNGIDLSRWDLSLDGGSVREELRIPRELPVFVYSGRFNTWKGPAELVRAAARLKQMGHDFRVLMVGDEDASAPAAHRVSIQSLRELASELRVLDNLVFTGFRPDLPRIFAAADAYAMPTFEEPFANVFLEALAMRRPVLGLDSGGVPEAVEHGRSGLLSQPNDIEQFASNMARLIREPQLRVDMGYYGRTRVEQQFQASRMTRDTERIYRRVLGQAAA
jgi:glycosyltransferase involved in cell wall biosynthesis